MKRWTVLACALLALLVWSSTALAAGVKSKVSLDFYRATVSNKVYHRMLDKQLDVAASKTTAKGVRLDLVLTKGQVRALRAKGISVHLLRNSKGQTARQAAAAQMTSGYNVWRDYDGPDGFRAYMYDLAKRNPQLLKLEVIGHTGKGREIIALKMTQGAKEIPDGSRPAALYSSLQHAREWIASEVNRRFLEHLIARWRANDKAVKDMLKTRELWFVLIANPDGYQYTFQSPDTRLWRKNLRDNNGDGIIQVGDGVDPNRNYPEHWNYDGEGSSAIQSSDTYRGPSAASEAETTAITGLFNRIDFRFQVNYHSFGQWLLYPQGWQIGTPTGDDPIYYALSGNKDNPAIPGFNPGLSSDVLYVTNGEMTDFAYSRRGTISWTPELSPGCPNCGFVFPDDEALVQAEFQRNLPFAMDVAKSVATPTSPVSHLGLTTKPFYLKSDDTYKFGLPEANFVFDYSYGDPQPVQVLAMKSLGDVTLKWQIEGDPTIHSASTDEWGGGEKYDLGTSRYYHAVRGVVTGTNPGDSVKVWFTGGGKTSDSFTYQAVSESTNDVLILSAEDYSGISPFPAPHAGPEYLGFYEDALAANGIGADVYDVDAQGRKAPTYLGVLSHYKAVVWYTGDDAITREPGWSAGNASRLAMDELLHIRSYLNEGGKVLYTGQFAGHQYTQGHNAQFYDPTEANARCTTPPAPTLSRCLILYGSTSSDLQGDVIEYWFGAFLTNEQAGFDEEFNLLDVIGTDNPFTGTSMTLNGGDSADNQGLDNASFISTSGILPLSMYPQFESWVAAKYDRPGGPFEPHSGTRYAYSQIADQSFKRFTHVVDVPAGGANMSFWTSYNTEADWDQLFVEAHTVGQDDWTTLQDTSVPSHTTQATGESCKPENGPGGWRTIHPFMDHYQTIVGDDCEPHGTSGDWWSSNGNSGGWQQWLVDLTGPGGRFAGKQIEVSITYVSDWSFQGLGVFLDDIVVSTGQGTTDFESGDGGWGTPLAPAGSAPNFNTWKVTDPTGFPEGAVIATPDTLYMGFGFEGITDSETRTEVMGRAMDYLLN